MSNKKGPKLTIYYSCQGCSFYEYKSNPPPSNSHGFCNKLKRSLISVDIPVSECPFKIENTEIFHKSELEKLANEERKQIEHNLTQVFYEYHDIEYDGRNKLNISIEDLDCGDVEKLNKFFPEWKWGITNHSDYGLRMYLSRE